MLERKLEEIIALDYGEKTGSTVVHYGSLHWTKLWGAPTWSWTSAEGLIKYGGIQRKAYSTLEVVGSIKMILKRSSNNPYGALSDGWSDMKALIFRVRCSVEVTEGFETEHFFIYYHTKSWGCTLALMHTRRFLTSSSHYQ